MIQQLSACEAGFVDVQVPFTILSSESGEFIPQDRQIKYNAISRRDRVPTVAAGKKNITYSDCVSVAFVMQHATCMRRIILSSMVVPYFSTSYKRNAFRKKKVIDHKICILICSTLVCNASHFNPYPTNVENRVSS